MSTISLLPSREASMAQSRASSPATEEPGDEPRLAICRWDDCDKEFPNLTELGTHLNQDHVGLRKTQYTCEWAGCSRKGLVQASRSALNSHLRGHTGERPYVCSVDGCDAAFTRQNARAKHMRQQHNREASPSARGRNRKRKRGEEASRDDTPASKIEGSTSTDADASVPPALNEEATVPAGDSLAEQIPSALPPEPYSQEASEPAVNGTRERERPSEEEDGIPEHLLQYQDPVSGRILGRSPDFIRYILMKAKYQFVMEQNEHLIEELRVVRHEEGYAREQKDLALDEVISTHLGPQADFLLQNAPLYHTSDAHIVAANGA